MREILFRGKAECDNKWYIGWYIPSYEYKWSAQDEIDRSKAVIEFVRDDLRPDFVPVKESTLGQYTGFTDRNGNKIFEGDIVERFHRFGNEIKRMYVVEHRGSWCLWDFDDNDDFLWNWCAPAYYHGEQVGGCIVIGNIHDNPELMEEE